MYRIKESAERVSDITTGALYTVPSRNKKFGLMITDKSQQLSKKVQHDALFISEIVKGNTLENTREMVKKLK